MGKDQGDIRKFSGEMMVPRVNGIRSLRETEASPALGQALPERMDAAMHVRQGRRSAHMLKEEIAEQVSGNRFSTEDRAFFHTTRTGHPSCLQCSQPGCSHLASRHN